MIRFPGQPLGRAAIAAVILSSLGAGGCDSVQGPDRDPATVELHASRSQLELLGDTVQLAALVRNSSGEALPDADVSWSSRSPAVVSVDGEGLATALANGSAWVVASSGVARDSVRLTVNSAIDCALAGALTVPDTRAGILSSADCDIGARNVDAWRLELAQERQVTVELMSSSFDALLVILDASGQPIAFNDDGAGRMNARVTLTIPAGVYFVYATSVGRGATGHYELSVYEGPAESLCPATASVSFPDTVTATITTGSCDFEGFLLDVWRLELPADTTVILQVESEDFDPTLVVADTTGFFLEFSGEGPGSSAWLEVRLEAGSYDIWLGAQEEGRTGSYTLSLRPGPTLIRCEAAGTVTVPARVTGELTADDCFLGFSAADPWELELAETTALGLSLSSDAFQPVILISDATGEVVDGFSGEGSRVEAETTLPAGRYRVWAMADDGAHGSYELGLSRADQLPDCEPEGGLAVGDTVQGALAITDCALPAGRYADVWTARLDSASAVTVVLASEKFQASLVLADSTGSRIERAEANGGGASVTVELEAGLYQLWATSGESDRVGAYTLALIADTDAVAGSRIESRLDRFLRRSFERGVNPWKRTRPEARGAGGGR